MKPQEHLRDGGLAGAGVAHDGSDFPTTHGEVEVVKGVLVGIGKAEARVREARHLVARTRRRGGGQTQGLGGVLDAGHGVEHGGGPGEARERPRDLDHRELSHHHEEHDEHGVLEQRGDGSDLHGSGTDAIGAEPHDEHLHDVHEKERRTVNHREEHVHADGVPCVVLEGLVQPAALALLLAKGTYDAGARDDLAEPRVHAVDEALHGKEDRGGSHDGEERDGKHGKGDEKEHPPHHGVYPKREDDGDHAGHRNREDHHEGHEQGLLHHIGVRQRAGDHRSRAKRVEVCARERQGLPVDGHTQVSPHIRGNSRCDVVGGHAPTGPHDRCGEHGNAVRGKLRRAAGTHGNVHKRRELRWDEQHPHNVGEEQREGSQCHGTMRPEKRGENPPCCPLAVVALRRHHASPPWLLAGRPCTRIPCISSSIAMT